MSDASSLSIWATAIARNEAAGRPNVFRYVRRFEPGFDRSGQPDRVILLWRYEAASGQPPPDLSERMMLLEDLLEPAVEAGTFGTLALVSTGENSREWIYHVRAEDEFLGRFNAALAEQPAFPIGIHAAPDPDWTTYETFRAGVVEQ